MNNLVDSLSKVPAILGAILSNAFTYVLSFAVGGIAAITYGTYLSFGLGASFITLGILLLIFMILIARGARG